MMLEQMLLVHFLSHGSIGSLFSFINIQPVHVLQMTYPKETTIDLNNVELDVKDVENDKTMSLPTQSRKKLIVCCSGIFICYFYYGIIQERM